MVMSILLAYRMQDQNRPWKPDEDKTGEDVDDDDDVAESQRKYEHLATPRRATTNGKPRRFSEVTNTGTPRKLMKIEKIEQSGSVGTPRKFQELATPRRTAAQGAPHTLEIATQTRSQDFSLALNLGDLDSPRREGKVVGTPRHQCSPRKAPTPRGILTPRLEPSQERKTPRIPQVETPTNPFLFDLIPEENPNCKLIGHFKVTTGRDELEAWVGGITILQNGHIAIADMANKTIKIFDMYGNMRKEFWGKGTYKFGEIRGITTTLHGNLLIADTERQLFYEFTPTGGQIKMKDSNGCWRLAVTSTGNTLVIDHKKRCVLMYTAKGILMRIIATANDDGKCVFVSPQSIAIGAEDSIIVTDDRLNAVQIFNKVGDHLKTYGQKGTGKGLLNGPKSVCTDEEGNIYVTDTANNMIQVLTPAGEFKETLLTRGDQIHLPWAIAYHKGKLIVAEQFGQVKIFQIISD